MACNGSVTWSTFSLESDVSYVSLLKVPPDAPEPRKSRADQETGLLQAAEDSASDQSEKERNCDKGCQETQAMELRKTSFPMSTVVYQWLEEYDGLDPAGNTLRLTGKYTAIGRATFIKRTLLKECAPSWFGNVAAYRLEGLGDVMVSAALLYRLPFEEVHGVLMKNGLLDKVEQPVETI